MKKMTLKRLLTLVTVLAIALSAMSFTAYAAEPETSEPEQEDGIVYADGGGISCYYIAGIVYCDVPAGVSGTLNIYKIGNGTPAQSEGISGYTPVMVNPLPSGNYRAILSVGGNDYPSSIWSV